jgi:hypothetical protein
MLLLTARNERPGVPPHTTESNSARSGVYMRHGDVNFGGGAAHYVHTLRQRRTASDRGAYVRLSGLSTEETAALARNAGGAAGPARRLGSRRAGADGKLTQETSIFWWTKTDAGACQPLFPSAAFVPTMNTRARGYWQNFSIPSGRETGHSSLPWARTSQSATGEFDDGWTGTIRAVGPVGRHQRRARRSRSAR